MPSTLSAGTTSFLQVLSRILGALWLALLVTPGAHAQSLEWTQLHPADRYSHAAAYDSARAVTVCFGGVVNGAYIDETWEWNGDSWRRRYFPGPAPTGRAGHAMAYDAARHVTVLFGGLSSIAPGLSNETWEYDGVTWTQRHPVNAPSPRRSIAMAYDSDRHVTVLFGGYSDSTGLDNAETWEWDGTNWAFRGTTGPSPRRYHAMSYDPVRHRTLLFGGYTGANNSETWEWDGASWHLRTSSGPSPRWFSSMAHDSTRHLTVLFGGNTGVEPYVPETWEWNGTSWTQRLVTNPPLRDEGTMVYDQLRRVCVLHAGVNAQATSTGQTWLWNGTGWIQRTQEIPLPRTGAGMVHDTFRGTPVMFGGFGDTLSAETWERSVSTWNYRTSTGPAARYVQGMAYDAGRHLTVLFGGAAGGGAFFGDTWEWNGTSWVQRNVAAPSPRGAQAMVYDAAHGVTVMFGGVGGVPGSPIMNGETWIWNGTSWSQRFGPGPSPRFYHAMAYDSARGVVVLYGGVTNIEAGTLSNETWEWNGTSWAQSPAAGPPARGVPAMVYDPTRSLTVLYGGLGGLGNASALDDLWEWNGSVWSPVQLANPAARYGCAAAYDPQRAQVLLFGGTDRSGANLSDTWSLGQPCAAPSITAPPADATICPGSAAHFTIAATGTQLLSYHWQVQTAPGVWTTVDNSPVTLQCGGSASDPNPNSASTTINLSPCPQVSHYQVRCVVTNDCGLATSQPATLTLSSADFNADGDSATDADIEAFFACVAGNCCDTCGSADFNGDGDTATDADIESFFRVLAGGSC